MLNQSVSFEFSGFNPEYEIKSSIMSVADRLYNLAPSDSVMKLALRKGSGQVEASCRIASQEGVFIADAKSNSPVTAVRQIESHIMRQIENWKNYRFIEQR
jgi:hypothetical protein